MIMQKQRYAGYDILICYDDETELYDYIISENKIEVHAEEDFDDNNDAFASACMWINNET